MVLFYQLEIRRTFAPSKDKIRRDFFIHIINKLKTPLKGAVNKKDDRKRIYQ